MNPEGAQTYLRLLAEAQLREPAMASWGGMMAGNSSRKLQLVARALISVDAIDPGTAETILADFDLAVASRQRHRKPDPAVWPPGGISRPSIPAMAAQIRAGGPGPGTRGQVPSAGRAAPGRAAPGPRPRGDGAPGAERFVPVGRTVLVDNGGGGGLYLMAYARTDGGARFMAAWYPDDPDSMGLPDVGLWTVTDDRGGRYALDRISTGGGPRWTGVITLSPDPPGDPGWLEICPAGGAVTRVSLGPSVAGAAVEGGRGTVGPGEHLLTLLAEQLLAEAQDLPRDRRQDQSPAGPLAAMATGLGEVVAALHAAEALAPDSPLPGRLATVCANLNIAAGLAAPPALDLPEPWLSALAHYHRRKPGALPVHEGAAAPVAVLPELDGIKLVLLGLHNAHGYTWLHLLARGMPRDFRHGPVGMEMIFPLSVWILDSGGRWHPARPAGRHRAGPDGPDAPEDLIRLRLAPALPRSATWIELLAAGRSAQVRVKLPLNWGYPP
jgi:hypothetical protein